jgi:hypothetical protein
MFVVVIKISTGSGRTHVAPPPIDRSIPKTESIDMDSVSRRPWRGRYTQLAVDQEEGTHIREYETSSSTDL